MTKIILYSFILLFYVNTATSQLSRVYIEKATASGDSSSYYFNLAKKSIKTSDDEIAYYMGKNLKFTNLNEIDSAIFYGIIAIKKIKKTNKHSLLFDTYISTSEGYRRQGQYDKAIDLILEGLKLAESQKNAFKIATFNMLLSLNYHDFESYKKGVYYGKRAFTYMQISKEKDVAIMARIINAIAINYDDWNKADSALYYHYKVFDHVKGKDTLLISRTYNNIGNTLLKQGKYKEARKWVRSGIAISETNFKNNKSEKEYITYYYENATHYTNLATIAYQLSEFSEAEKLFDKSFYFAAKSKSAEKMRDYYQHRYLFNRKRKNLKETAKYQEKYITLRDSVFDIERAAKFTELETKYQTEKKEKELLQSKTNELESKSKIKEKNIQFTLLFIFIFVIVLISYFIYRHQKLKQKNQEQEFKLKSTFSQIENHNKLQEQRLNISRDLHDNIGAQLTFIISSVDNIKYGFDIQNNKLNNKLSNISDFAKATILELRDTIWAMNNNAIQFEDLKSRILNFIEKAKEATEDIQFEITIQQELNDVELSSLVGMNIYRTIQEAINNAIKYAKASRIELIAGKRNDQLIITIEDNGIGFDVENTCLGNGINNMKKRTEEIGATIDIQSQLKTGTKIILTMNVEEF